MAQTITIVNNVNLQIGATNFGVEAIPAGFTFISVSINRANMNSTTLRMDWGIELSTDNQQTWLPWGGASLAGGPVVDPDTGQTITGSSFTVDLPGTSPATGWFFRGVATTNERIRTTIKAVIS